MKPRSATLAGMLVILGSLCSCSESMSGSPARQVDSSVRRGDLVQRIVLTGEVDVRRADLVSVPSLPEWQSTIKWLAEDGIDLRKGDRVIDLDNTTFVSGLEDRRTRLSEAEHQLAQKRAELQAEGAEKSFDLERRISTFEKAKLKVALPKDVISEREAQDNLIELERAKNELEKVRESLRALDKGADADQRNLELTLETARQEISIAEEAISRVSLVSPGEGLFLISNHPWEGRKFQVGDRVWVGLQLAKLPDLSTVEVVANLWDVDDRRISVGERAMVTIDAYPDKAFPGTVTAIAPVAQESSRLTLRRSFRTVVKLDRIDPAVMRPGLSAKITIENKPRRNVMLTKRRFIRREKGATGRVAIDGADRAITMGPCNAEECVIEKGVKEGEKLELPRVKKG
ncbi:MAG TPA: efflux RND transporter periplasmic adaptor subunit [Thermoanaerobaculia bacterium]|nr:efflux RND transporter periplasmic adaptor subunit [Thermoanaerobaculia bacterium]